LNRIAQITFREPADETIETGEQKLHFLEPADGTQETGEKKLHLESQLMRH
jgi:hypothetical protein